MNDTRSAAVPTPDFLEFLALQRADYRNGLQQKLAHMSALWRLVVEGHDDRGAIGELERAAHSLAGSGATFGFAELGTSARALELAVGRVIEGAAPPSSAQRAEILAAIVAVTDRIPEPEEHPLRKPLERILYVEDEADIRTVAKMALEAVGGFSVFACSSGSEAVKAAPGAAPDLLLLDVMMPGMDGPATLRALRAIPATATTPVVFMTAKVQAAEIAQYRALGALDVIAKPFDPMQVSAEIRKIWAARPAAAEE